MALQGVMLKGLSLPHCWRDGDACILGHFHQVWMQTTTACFTNTFRFIIPIGWKILWKQLLYQQSAMVQLPHTFLFTYSTIEHLLYHMHTKLIINHIVMIWVRVNQNLHEIWWKIWNETVLRLVLHWLLTKIFISFLCYGYCSTNGCTNCNIWVFIAPNNRPKSTKIHMHVFRQILLWHGTVYMSVPWSGWLAIEKVAGNVGFYEHCWTPR